MNELLQETSAYWVLSDLVVVHLTGEQSDGRFELLEFLMPPGDMTPLHVHTYQSQTTYVLEGEVTFWMPGKTIVCGPGELCYQPAGVPQTEKVTSNLPARVLDINSPAGFDDFGFDRFVAALGRPAERRTLPPQGPPPDLGSVMATASKYGVEILGPPGALP